MQTFLFRNFSAGAERENRTFSFFSPVLATTNSALNAWTEPKSSSNRPGSRFHMNTHPSLARFRFNLELIRVIIQSPLQSSKLYNEVRQCKDETKHPLANFETPYVVHFQNRSERWNEGWSCFIFPIFQVRTGSPTASLHLQPSQLGENH